MIAASMGRSRCSRSLPNRRASLGWRRTLRCRGGPVGCPSGRWESVTEQAADVARRTPSEAGRADDATRIAAVRYRHGRWGAISETVGCQSVAVSKPSPRLGWIRAHSEGPRGTDRIAL